MTLRMADSIDPTHLPEGYDAYLGYVDGSWPDFKAEVAKFPHAHLVSLTVFAGVLADGCDCETGDLTVAQAAGWAKWRLNSGAKRPIVYTGAANMQALIDALAALAVSRGEVRLLSAHYAGEHICGPTVKDCGYPQADGTQWTQTAPGAGGSQIDESLLRDDFFGGPPMSLTGPAHWDAEDWEAWRTHDLGTLYRALTGDAAGVPADAATSVRQAHAAVLAAIPTPAAIAKAVIAALPPAAPPPAAGAG